MIDFKNTIRINKEIAEPIQESNLDEDIFKMIKASLSEERIKGEFKFRYMLSEIL